MQNLNLEYLLKPIREEITEVKRNAVSDVRREQDKREEAINQLRDYIDAQFKASNKDCEGKYVPKVVQRIMEENMRNLENGLDDLIIWKTKVKGGYLAISIGISSIIALIGVALSAAQVFGS